MSEKEKTRAVLILRTTAIVTVIFCVLGLLFWGFKKLSDYGQENEIRDKDHEITEEEAKKKILEKFSEVFQETTKILESHLQFLAKRTSYLKDEDPSVRKVFDFVKKELERNNKEVFSSLPRNSEEILQGIEGAKYRKSILFHTIFLPRFYAGSIDWKAAWKKLSEKEKIDKNKIKKKSKEIKEIIQDDYNFKIKNEVQKLVDADNLSEINKWMNEYLDKIIIGDFILSERDKISSRIGERLTHNLVEYQTVTNRKTGFSMQIHIFSC